MIRANLQVLPTLLVDGMVAGTWSVQAGRREATLSLRPSPESRRPTARRCSAAAGHHVLMER